MSKLRKWLLACRQSLCRFIFETPINETYLEEAKEKARQHSVYFRL